MLEAQEDVKKLNDVKVDSDIYNLSNANLMELLDETRLTLDKFKQATNEQKRVYEEAEKDYNWYGVFATDNTKYYDKYVEEEESYHQLLGMKINVEKWYRKLKEEEKRRTKKLAKKLLK